MPRSTPSVPYRIKDCETQSELLQIIDLQARNTPSALTEADRQSQGFVTVVHDLPLLKKMNHPYPHQIALDSHDQVVGYALVMEPRWRNEIPILIPMFEQIDMLEYQGVCLTHDQYVVMGQICIAKDWRGIGLFDQLYFALRDTLQPTIPFLITEIDFRNKRSYRAHDRIGFKVLKRYDGNPGVDWALIIWDWS